MTESDIEREREIETESDREWHRETESDRERQRQREREEVGVKGGQAQYSELQDMVEVMVGWGKREKTCLHGNACASAQYLMAEWSELAAMRGPEK